MEFQLLTAESPLWGKMKEYAARCSWSAGKSLAQAMENGAFTDWERVIAAVEDGEICGFCTAAKTDCIPDVDYTPYIGFVFVDEKRRGRRLSQRMIGFAGEYLKSLGFHRVYLTSDHENLYEKYGFTVIDRKRASWGEMEKIYTRAL